MQDILVTDRFSAPLEVDRELYDFEWDIPYYGVDKEMFPAPREVDRELYIIGGIIMSKFMHKFPAPPEVDM